MLTEKILGKHLFNDSENGDPIANDCVAAFETWMVVESQILDNFTVALIRDQLGKCWLSYKTSISYKFSSESVAVTNYLLLLGVTLKMYDHIENI